MSEIFCSVNKKGKESDKCKTCSHYEGSISGGI